MGHVLLAQLPRGTYSITISAPDFKTASVSQMEVHAGDRIRRDFMLEVGEMHEAITINLESAASRLSPRRSRMSSNGNE